jgi:hypothetical protein
MASDDSLTLTPVLTGINKIVSIQPYPLKSNVLTIVTQTGQIWLTNTVNNNKQLFLDISSEIGQLSSDNSYYEERGLLGLAFHADFCKNRLFYIYYTYLDRNSTSPPVLFVDPFNPDSLNQSWTDYSLYDHINVLEEWTTSYDQNGSINNTMNRPLLMIKQPFSNNNGQNNLIWNKNRLLLITGDGGYLYDPFNLAQSDNYPHGKILAIYPQRIATANIAIVSLDQISSQGIKIISKGIRNSHGMVIEDDIVNLIHNGQNLMEGLFRYNICNNYNIGWAGWENGLPTTSPLIGNGANNVNIPNQLSSDSSLQLVSPSVKIINWNKNTGSSSIVINNGDKLRFISTDVNTVNDIYITDSTYTRLISTIYKNNGGRFDFIYQPSYIDQYINGNNVGTNVGNNIDDNVIYFTSSRYPSIQLKVSIIPSKSTINNIIWYSSQYGQEVIPKILSNINIVTFNNRILNPKILPYLRYAHYNILGTDGDGLGDDSLNILGTIMTGVTYYDGPLLPTGLILSEWNIKVNNDVTSNKGALIWVNLNRNAEHRAVKLNITNRDMGFYTTVGMVNGRLFVASYNAINVNNFNQAILWEVKT